MSTLRLQINEEIPQQVKALMVASLQPGQNLEDWVVKQATGNAIAEHALLAGAWEPDTVACEQCGGRECLIRSISEEYVCPVCDVQPWPGGEPAAGEVAP